MAPQTAVLDRTDAPPAVLTVVLPVEAVGKSKCDACGHGRKQHSIQGCVEPGCGCTVKYMDL
jgi:hypothetical protein